MRNLLLGLLLGVTLVLLCGSREAVPGPFQCAVTTEPQGHVVVMVLNTRTGASTLFKVGNLEIAPSTPKDYPDLLQQMR